MEGDSTRPEHPEMAADLHAEAQALRAELRERRLHPRHEYSGVSKFLILLLTLALLVGAVGLLVFPQQRRQLVATLFGEKLKPVSGDQIVYSLPPPPPKTPASRPAFPVVAGQPSSGPPGDAVEGVLYTRSGPPLPGSAAAAEAAQTQPGFQPPPRTPEAEQALAVLRGKVELIARLLDGQLEDMEAVGWNPVKAEPPVFWLDVVAKRGEQDLHLVWEVNVEREVVRPLSQAARDLTPR